jgi:hypothetical protein
MVEQVLVHSCRGVLITKKMQDLSLRRYGWVVGVSFMFLFCSVLLFCFVMLGMEPRTLSILSKCSAAELQLQPTWRTGTKVYVSLRVYILNTGKIM